MARLPPLPKKLPPGLTLRQLSDRFRIPPQTIRARCLKIGYRPPTVGEAQAAQVRALPPGLTIWEVLKKLGLQYATARRICRAFGYPYRRGTRGRPAGYTKSLWATMGKDTSERWKKVDWTQRDVVIARLTHRTRQRVSQVRAQLGIKPTRHLKLETPPDRRAGIHPKP